MTLKSTYSNYWRWEGMRAVRWRRRSSRRIRRRMRWNQWQWRWWRHTRRQDQNYWCRPRPGNWWCSDETASRCRLPAAPHRIATTLYTVSQKTVQTYFWSKLCQILTDCKNFWHKDSRENKLFWCTLIFHLTLFMSTHYRVKCRCSKLLHKAVIISLQ